MSKQFESRGKLLLSGEYVVLDGALALAVPTNLGQSMSIDNITEPIIRWQSLDHQNQNWLKATFKLPSTKTEKFEIIEASDTTLATRLSALFSALALLQPQLFSINSGFYIESRLEFPQDWGLGSSSTLINNLAQWAEVDPYELLKMSFGGSGYDIACASATSSISYQLITNNTANSSNRTVETVDFDPSFKEHLYFIHLNKKQNSREGIARYRSNSNTISPAIQHISDISREMIGCKSLDEFQTLMNLHESIIAKLIDMEPVKGRHFKDFNGQIKSLGAWGGDFIMAASNDDVSNYFNHKGYTTILRYDEMVLTKKGTI